MKKLICLLVVFSLVVSTSGCATILKPKTTEISLTSEPTNARVYINGNPMGRTPSKLRVSDKYPLDVLFTKNGYEGKSYHVGVTAQKGWLLIGFMPFFIPMIVDALTGNWNTLREKEIHGILDLTNINE